MTLNGHFAFNYVLFLSVCSFTYVDNATISILGMDNIFGEGHMYKPKLLNILRLDYLTALVCLSQFNVFQRTQAYYLNVQ